MSLLSRAAAALCVSGLALSVTASAAGAAPQADTPGPVAGVALDLARTGAVHAGGAGLLIPSGQPGHVDGFFQIFRPGHYTDLHWSTSHPGSMPRCDLAKLGRDAEQMGVASERCRATLPAAADGQVYRYSATLSGKRWGAPFATGASLAVRGLDLQARVFANGKEVTGKPVYVPKTGTVRLAYVFTNRSRTTVANSYTLQHNLPGACRLGSISPGKSKTCVFNLSAWDAGLTPSTPVMPLPGVKVQVLWGWLGWWELGTVRLAG